MLKTMNIWNIIDMQIKRNKINNKINNNNYNNKFIE